MPVVAGVSDCVPEIALLPVHAPVAVQAVALLVFQVSVVADPMNIEVGLAENEIVGSGSGWTDRITVRVTDPPALVQVSV